MYKLENNQVIQAPNQGDYKGQTCGNFTSFLSRQPIEERQQEGWYLNLIQSDVTEITTDSAQDAIIIPIPVPLPEQPFSISKVKLGDAFEALGVIAQFEAYIASSPTLARRYRDAVVLMSDDPMVVGATNYFKQALGLDDEQLKLLIESCRSDI